MRMIMHHLGVDRQALMPLAHNYAVVYAEVVLAFSTRFSAILGAVCGADGKDGKFDEPMVQDDSTAVRR